jgi:hypothetical protein
MIADVEIHHVDAADWGIEIRLVIAVIGIIII